MIPVDQTRYGHPHGNCLAASIASILEIPVDAVPVVEMSRRWPAMVEFVRAFGLDLVAVDLATETATMYGAEGPVSVVRYPATLVPDGYCIGSGQSARGVQHACVYLNGELAHDPHPSRLGIRGVDRWYLFLPISPSKGE